MDPGARKSTQRERLLNGVVEAANRRGYAGASVSAVIEDAGVSRPTYYEYFADRDASFIAAIDDIQQDLLSAVVEALTDAKPERSLPTAVAAIVEFANEEPARARFITSESLSGSKAALDARDAGVAAIAAAIAHAEEKIDGDAIVCDLDSRVVIGSVYRMIAMRLRRGQHAISKLIPDLLSWLASYEAPARQRSWSSLAPGPASARSRHLPEKPIQPTPKLLPPGRPRISEAEVAENHRARVLYAAARLAEEKGYLATTIADITKLARIDGRGFYRLFADKQEAFAALHELGFQQLMDVTARAFFAVEGWPARSWEAGMAFTQMLQENPLISRVGFVEAYAVGPGAVQRVEDSHTAFMFFLQEGLLHSADEHAPSRVAMEATISAIFEIVYLQARRLDEPQIAGMLPQIAHLWLTPFLGVAEANSFIEARTRGNPKFQPGAVTAPRKRRKASPVD